MANITIAHKARVELALAECISELDKRKYKDFCDILESLEKGGFTNSNYLVDALPKLANFIAEGCIIDPIDLCDEDNFNTDGTCRRLNTIYKEDGKIVNSKPFRLNIKQLYVQQENGNIVRKSYNVEIFEDYYRLYIRKGSIITNTYVDKAYFRTDYYNPHSDSFIINAIAFDIWDNRRIYVVDSRNLEFIKFMGTYEVPILTDETLPKYNLNKKLY